MSSLLALPRKVLVSNSSKYKHEIFWIRQHGYTVVRRTRDCHSNPSFRQVLEPPCLPTLHARGCCGGVKPPSPLGDRAALRHLQRLHPGLGPANRNYSSDFSPHLPQRSKSTSHPPFPARRYKQGSPKLFCNTCLQLPALSSSLSKDAYWDREINTLHCQKPTKRRLLQLK